MDDILFDAIRNAVRIHGTEELGNLFDGYDGNIVLQLVKQIFPDGGPPVDYVYEYWNLSRVVTS
jgi:hypothetical protein